MHDVLPTRDYLNSKLFLCLVICAFLHNSVASSAQSLSKFVLIDKLLTILVISLIVFPRGDLVSQFDR